MQCMFIQYTHSIAVSEGACVPAAGSSIATKPRLLVAHLGLAQAAAAVHIRVLSPLVLALPVPARCGAYLTGMDNYASQPQAPVVRQQVLPEAAVQKEPPPADTGMQSL